MELELTARQQFVYSAIRQGVANEILYGGAAGGGKSWLLRAISIIIAMEVPSVQIFLFRRKVKDLKATHMRGPTSYPIMLQEFIDDKLCRIDKSNNVIEFENNAVISLNHCQHESDVENFLSAEIHVLLMDESTTFSESMIRKLRARVRLGSLDIPEGLKLALPFILYGTNPKGPSHHYFKTNFVDADEEDTPFKAPKYEGGMKRMFVPSRIEDNPHLEKEYAEKLEGLGDPDLVKAYKKGDWTAVEGAALPNLSRFQHVIRHEKICKSWKLKRAYDYGFSAPYAVLYYRVATGESSTSFNPPKGSIIFSTEIYGADIMNLGLREPVGITARKMDAHEQMEYPGETVYPGPADNSIFDKEQGPSIAEDMAAECPNIEFCMSNKSPGSRVLGLSAIRTMLQNAIDYRNEKPGIYFSTRTEKHTFKHLKSIQLDEKNVEDVDTSGNDHIYDVARYVVLDKVKEISVGNVKGT